MTLSNSKHKKRNTYYWITLEVNKKLVPGPFVFEKNEVQPPLENDFFEANSLY